MIYGKDKSDANSGMQATAIARQVVMVVFDGVEILDVAGPASVIGKANELVPGSYELRVVGPDEGLVHSNSRITMALHGSWKSINPHAIDTLIVAGGNAQTVLHSLNNGDLAQWLSSVAPFVRRVASVCTGAFALGRAGLLKGRSAITHWTVCELLQNHFPEASIKSDKIYVRDGNIWTSAGILTGIDMALALVEEDLGKECALKIANILVVAGMRPGESPQKSALLGSQAQVSDPLRELLSWIGLHLTQDLSSPLLAERMGMSDRHFRRLFQQQMGMSPAKYVTMARLDHAAVLLRSTRWTIESVARKSGFDSVDTLQRGFVRRWALSPGQYRERHGSGVGD